MGGFRKVVKVGDGFVFAWRDHGRQSAFGALAPDDEAAVFALVDDVRDGVAGPLFGLGFAKERFGRRDPVLVQAVPDFLLAAAGFGLFDDPPYDGGGYWVDDENVVVVVAVFFLNLLQLVAVGCPIAGLVAALGNLALAVPDFLAEVVGVELVNVLDDILHEPASGRVIGLLLDGDDADAALLEPVLVDSAVNAVARETRELLDQDGVEGFFLGVGV